MSKRESISKRVRFAVFARDNFTCRYCGKQADTTPLHIDHVIPVCQDGTNDESNLVTSCADCNLGKSGKKISQSVPNETDRLRLAQELNEQIEDAKRVKASMKLRKKRRQDFIDFWCDQTKEEQVQSLTASIVFSYVEQFGEEVVYPWIELAAVRCRWNDRKMGQYISGIRRNYLLENEL